MEEPKPLSGTSPKPTPSPVQHGLDEKLEPPSSASSAQRSLSGFPREEDGAETDAVSEETAMSDWPLAMLTAGMMTVVFLVALDHYILATAIPRITTDFNSLQDAAWYSSGYFLTNMALQPAFGTIYTYFPVKLTYIACIFVFELGSVICAIAPSSAVLIIGRLITGVGGGGLYIGSVVLIGYAVPSKRRPLYISIVTTLDGAASVAGPLLGGVFTDSRLTWRFCFWINLPVGFVAFVIIAFSCKNLPQGKDGTLSIWSKILKVDWLSMSLLLGGFAALLLPLQWAGPVYAWSDPHVWGCLIGSVAILTSYLVYQGYRGDEAAIPYRILRQRTVFFSSGFMLLMAMLIGVLVYYLPFEFQAVRGTNAETSGRDILPFLMTLMFSPLLSGALISLLSWYVPFMWLGSILATTGSALLTMLTARTSKPQLIAYQFLAGLGAGISHQIPYTSINSKLPPEEMILGSALCSFLNSLGTVLGIVVAQAIFAGILTQRLELQPGMDARAVIRAGPTNIETAVPAALVGVVRKAYEEALRNMFLLPVVLGALCCVCCVGVEWIRLKH